MTTLQHKAQTAIRNPRAIPIFIADKLLHSKLYKLFIQIMQFGVWLTKNESNYPPIKDYATPNNTAVDSFWTQHTVMTPKLIASRTKKQDEDFIKWRAGEYPMFHELMELWGDHTGETIVDYGCGPGTDIIGFLLYSRASKVIGIDISSRALWFAQRRIALHRIPTDRIELIHISDSASTIPLASNSIDYIYSEGVLHHTSHPEKILAELYRILKPNSKASIMVYNRESIWYHLYVAYEQMILQGKYKGFFVGQAFPYTTDTEDCPIARCYKPEEFTLMCQQAGFTAEYAGGYYTRLELDMFNKYARQAINDHRLGEEHRQFLSELDDSNSLPTRNGKLAGIGGVYHLEKS